MIRASESAEYLAKALLNRGGSSTLLPGKESDAHVQELRRLGAITIGDVLCGPTMERTGERIVNLTPLGTEWVRSLPGTTKTSLFPLLAMNLPIARLLVALWHRIRHDWFGVHRSNGQVSVGFDDYHDLCSTSTCPECGRDIVRDHRRWVLKDPVNH